MARLADPAIVDAGVLPWASPVPSFGDLSTSRVATLGINPSNREFVNASGNELTGEARRLHTLLSLGLKTWDKASVVHASQVYEACCEYFQCNPYETWFRSMNDIIEGTETSYYSENSPACHLDLIPYATTRKWSELATSERKFLYGKLGDTLGLLLQQSSVQILILNGMTVVRELQRLAGVRFVEKRMTHWSLPRSGIEVPGISFEGTVSEISGVKLSRRIRVLGYNHNIQSSYGVTSQVKIAIQDWIGNRMETVG